MTTAEELLEEMTFEFMGRGQHKIEMEKLFETEGALLLDVRFREERDAVDIRMDQLIDVLWIPINEIPRRLIEIPRDRTIGVFCSAGVRSTMVYFYLCSLGYDKVRIAPSHYDAITSMILPGKLYKALASKR